MTTAIARQPEELGTPNAMQLLQSAISQGASIDTIERLAKLQREMVEYQAKVDFNEAMQRVQDKMRPIGADMNNPQTKSKYASYVKLDKALRPLYSADGFALSFNTEESHLPDHVRVLCSVSRGGYEKPYQIDMPNDGKGAKGGDVMTKTHATGAGVSYGMRYLLKMIFNVAVGEDDNDGNTGDGLAETEFVSWMDLIKDAQDEAALKKYFSGAYMEANKLKDKASMDSFIEAKDRRKQELHDAN